MWILCALGGCTMAVVGWYCMAAAEHFEVHLNQPQDAKRATFCALLALVIASYLLIWSVVLHWFL